jgi:hypothetical protein
MTGNPTITLLGGFSEAGLPIAFQRATVWHRRHPVA